MSTSRIGGNVNAIKHVIEQAMFAQSGWSRKRQPRIHKPQFTPLLDYFFSGGPEQMEVYSEGVSLVLVGYGKRDPVQPLKCWQA